MPIILLAVDGSEHALRTTQKLIANAAWYRELPQVRLVYVHLPIPEVHGLHRVLSREAVERYYQEEGEAALAPCRQLLAQAKIPFESKVLVGPVAETVVAHATATGSDLIYMGTRGKSSVSSMLLGSIATKVLHLATTPVVLVH